MTDLTYVFAFSTGLLALAVFVLAFMFYRQFARLRKNEVESSRVDDVSMREEVAVEADRRALTMEFLRLHATTLTKFDSMLSAIRRKLVAGQVAEVKAMLSNESMMEDHANRFNKAFDSTIFNLYPDFIEQVNKLLVPERRIEVAEKGQLTTELRVLAFTCIGFDDTAMITRFLRLSPNTIYTYRNRMRSRALDRESFDRSIQRIGVVGASND